MPRTKDNLYFYHIFMWEKGQPRRYLATFRKGVEVAEYLGIRQQNVSDTVLTKKRKASRIKVLQEGYRIVRSKKPYFYPYKVITENNRPVRATGSLPDGYAEERDFLSPNHAAKALTYFSGEEFYGHHVKSACNGKLQRHRGWRFQWLDKVDEGTV